MIHRVVRGHDPLWVKLWNDFISQNPGHYVASEYRPGSGIQYYKTIAKDNDGGTNVPANKWAKIITRSYIRDIILKASSISKNPDELNGPITSWLNNEFKEMINHPTNSPAKIVFDELEPDYNAFFETFFNVVNQSTDPVISGYKTNFCVYLWPGNNISYSNVQSSLTSILKCGADILPEFYFKHSDYCGVVAKAKIDGADKWMKEIMAGAGNEKKLDYLYGLKQNIAKTNQLANQSGIYPAIPVGYPHLNLEKDQERFPVRIMHNIVSLGSKFFNSFNYNGSTNLGFGSYKWSINATGILSFDDESPSWNQLISQYVTNPDPLMDEEQKLSLNDFERCIVESNKRIEKFIEGWNYYCKLTKKEVETQLTKGQKKIAPLRSAGSPNCSANSLISPIGAFSGIGYKLTRWTGDPTIHRKKNAPTNDDLIQKGNTTHAFIAKTVTPFNNSRGISNQEFNELAGKGFYDASDIISGTGNPSMYSRFDLWITEVSYGFAAANQTAVSKYYTRSYSRSLKLTPISVQGICYNENEYDDLADFIREGQVAISQEPKNTFRLYIPAAKIDCIGVIETFQGGFNPNNQGVPTAPRFQFDFIIFKDLNDNVQKIGTTAKTIIYNFNEDPYWVRAFKDYKNDYIVGQLIDEILTNPTKPEVGPGQGGPQNAREATASKISDLVDDTVETVYEAAAKASNEAVDAFRKVIDDSSSTLRRFFS